MKFYRRLIISALVFVLAMLCIGFFVGEAQESQTRLAHSNGNGTLRVGDQQFKISAAVVKLSPDHKAEITLVADIHIFLSGTWSNHSESQNEVELEFAGSDSRGGFEGTGKASLGDDSKSLKRLALKGISRATKRPVEADFEGK